MGLLWVCSSDIVIGVKLLIWVHLLAIEILPRNHTKKLLHRNNSKMLEKVLGLDDLVQLNCILSFSNLCKAVFIRLGGTACSFLV